MRLINVTVQTKSRQRRVEELSPDDYRVRTNTAPSGGQANADVQKQLAEHLGVAKSRLTLVRGAASRKKVFRVD